MGIPRLVGSLIRKGYGKHKFIREEKLSNVYSLNIDANALVHDAASEVFAYKDKMDENLKKMRTKFNEKAKTEDLEKKLFEEVWKMILELVRYYRPKSYLVIAFDGVPVLAKIQHQRQRRFLSSLKDKGRFDSNCITTGTEFMCRLDEFLRNMIDAQRDFIVNNRHVLPPNIIYSSHLEEGEGEHKIMKYFRTLFSVNHIAGSHVIHGLDADFVMLSVLSPLDNIVLSRYDEREVIFIEEFKAFLASDDIDLGDFVLLCFLIGNDFVPPIPSLMELVPTAKFDTILMLIDIYKEMGINITEQGADDGIYTVDMNNFSSFIEKISEKENDLLLNMVKSNARYAPDFFSKSVKGEDFYPETLMNLWYDETFAPRNPEIKLVAKRYLLKKTDRFSLSENSLEELNYDKDESVKNMVAQYVKMLQWILLYYQKGHYSVDFEAYYPYHQAPFLKDLALNMKDMPIYPYQRSNLALPFTSLHLLAAVMPKYSMDVIPEELHKLYEDHSIIYHTYPEKFEVTVYGNHEKVDRNRRIAAIPMIDTFLIRIAMKTLDFGNLSRIKQWKKVETYRFERHETEYDHMVDKPENNDINLNQPWFDSIKQGRKTVEGRLNLGRMTKLRPGQEIIFFNYETRERLKVLIKAIRKYNSIQEYVSEEGVENVAPHMKNEQETISEYNKIYRKTLTKLADEGKAFPGILAIQVTDPEIVSEKYVAEKSVPKKKVSIKQNKYRFTKTYQED